MSSAQNKPLSIAKSSAEKVSLVHVVAFFSLSSQRQYIVFPQMYMFACVFFKIVKPTTGTHIL